jgi:hypothetical protein
MGLEGKRQIASANNSYASKTKTKSTNCVINGFELILWFNYCICYSIKFN